MDSGRTQLNNAMAGYQAMLMEMIRRACETPETRWLTCEEAEERIQRAWEKTSYGGGEDERDNL